MIYAFIDIKITYFYHHVILHPMQDANSHLVLKKHILSEKVQTTKDYRYVYFDFFPKNNNAAIFYYWIFFQEPNVQICIMY